MPATPKVATRGGVTTPKSAVPASSPAPAAPAAAPTIASLSTDPTLASPADPALAAAPRTARQAASPGPRIASVKPNDTAESPGTASGSYGVQLASSPVEAEANAAFAKLKKKYPAQLGSHTATVHKAETGTNPCTA